MKRMMTTEEAHVDTLAAALRTMLAVYCEDDGTTPEACQAAERQAREALADSEGGEE